jgi:RimJ/RimL family protein N-acetyltransferase
MTAKLSNQRITLREIKANDIFGFYEILSDKETMNQFDGPVMDNDIDKKDIVARMKVEREKNISYFWSIILQEEKEFIGFVRLYSYNSEYFKLSFSAMGDHINDDEFLSIVDKINGWEIDYALLPKFRNKGIMSEAVGLVVNYCNENSILPVYGKVNSLKNEASVKVLINNSFDRLMPLIADPNILKTKDLDSIIRDKDLGMMFVMR